MKRILLFGLLAGVLAANAGCGLFYSAHCRPYGNRGCGALYYNSGNDCGGVGCAEPRCASCVPGIPRRAYAYNEFDGGCDTCGDGEPCIGGCGYARPWHRGPLSCVFAHLGHLFFWCPSCGERYWGDYYGDPPDCNDPCDGFGNYAGGGCATCGGSQGYVRQNRVYSPYRGNRMVEEMPMMEGEVISQNERMVTPAPAPTSTLKSATEPHRAVKPSASARINAGDNY